MSVRGHTQRAAVIAAIALITAWAPPASATTTVAAAGSDTTAAARASVARTATSASKPAATSSAARPRRLEDIPIDGDVAMPQVLFITGRDQRRIPCVHHRRYLPEAKALGEATVLPARLAVSGAAPAAAAR